MIKAEQLIRAGQEHGVNSAASKQRKPSCITVHTFLPLGAFLMPIMEMFTSVTLGGKWCSDAANGYSLDVLQGKQAGIFTEGQQ